MHLERRWVIENFFSGLDLSVTFKKSPSGQIKIKKVPQSSPGRKLYRLQAGFPALSCDKQLSRFWDSAKPESPFTNTQMAGDRKKMLLKSLKHQNAMQLQIQYEIRRVLKMN
jgi:hypothetical protein